MQFNQNEWPENCGVVHHNRITQERMFQLLGTLHEQGVCDQTQALKMLSAADKICNMAMWLTAHMTYAKRVKLSGEDLMADDFKDSPQGHTGGSLNMVPAYVGYLLANALTGKSRAWLMGQGHCVAAIDAVNVLVRNVESEQKAAYPLSEQGLSTLCADFYSYEHDENGYPKAPLGSHVNPHTAGGILEGGYLGFASLQYVHMPLPEQELVAFLSDGAFEEQRGSDWSPRWWRGEDTGLIMPIMIVNGRRIEQRTSIEQKGGIAWLTEHLCLNNFDPIQIDGRDPASFAWAIIKMAELLEGRYQQLKTGCINYPITLPYAIAETIKGYGFPGAGSNDAHNLPLGANPRTDEKAREKFNKGIRKLHVPFEQLTESIACLNNHEEQGRVLERDHCLRKYSIPQLESVHINAKAVGEVCSPMSQLDDWFASFAAKNRRYRFRVANPDELRSNRFVKTLEQLKHRVNRPEDGNTESVLGSVITALNEEATISAALANKQGVNLVVSYEAFAVKMLGAMRQEVIFARNMKIAKKEVNWLSVPVLLSSHTWENGKNEISHQDPTLSEAWLQEMQDVAPVYFPFDANSAMAIMRSLYRQTGRVAALVVPKTAVPNQCTEQQSQQLFSNGAFVFDEKAIDRQIVDEKQPPTIQLLCVGAFQLLAAQQAQKLLREQGIQSTVIAITEPGKFRQARDELEAQFTHNDEQLNNIIPDCELRIFISHTHADVMTGVLRRLDTGPGKSVFLGYENRGGTLDVEGMQLLNRQDPANIVRVVLELLSRAK